MTKPFKPQLACDFDQDKLVFPIIAMPKLDGVRALNIKAVLVGRSLKQFKNEWVTAQFSGGFFSGFDGELAFGDWTAADLCRETTGFVNRKSPKPGKPVEGDIKWWLFDYLHESVIDLPYVERLKALKATVERLQLQHSDEGIQALRVVPWIVVNDLEQLQELESNWLEMGFEGAILRDPNGMHKSGRATVRGGSYLRIKRFIDFEVEVVSLVEARENQNVAKVNELGHTERSTHKENMVGKNTLGGLTGRALSDVVIDGRIVIAKGALVEAGMGNMDHPTRDHYWQNQNALLGKIAKIKFFPKGMKDALRFPTFVCLRAEEDMSE